MGLVCSRPISDFLESGFLKCAEIIDNLVRLSNKSLQGAITTCFSAVFGRDSALVQERKRGNVCLANAGGVCLLPVGNTRMDEKERRSERRRRAEAAALGQKVRRKHSTNDKHGYGKVAGVDPDEEQRLLRQSLGDPIKAPPPRPEAERETARERERGKLWVMGNVAASAHDEQVQPLLSHAGPSRPQQARMVETAAEARSDKKVAKHREVAPLLAESPGLVVRKHPEHPRQVSAESRASAKHVDVIASSSQPVLDPPQKAATAADRHDGAARLTAQHHAADAAGSPPGMKEIRPRVSSKSSPITGDKVRPLAPGGQANSTSFHSKPHAAVNASTSDHAIIHSGAMTTRKGAAIAPPTDVSGHDKLKLSAAPLTGAFDGALAQTSKAKQELRKQKPRTSVDITRIELEGKAPVPPKASDETGQPRRVVRPIPVVAPRARMSMDAIALGTATAAGSDAASIHSVADSTISVRAGSPLGVAELADRACLSAQDAPRKERKVWKDEVERLAIQKLMKQDAAARRGSGAGLAALRRIETQDGRLRWDPSTAASSTGGDHSAGQSRSASPALLVRKPSQNNRRRQSMDVAAAR